MTKMQFFIDEDGIKHFGIKGMKWGVRRFQNEDGSLTPAGRERYQKLSKKYSKYESKARKQKSRADLYRKYANMDIKTSNPLLKAGNAVVRGTHKAKTAAYDAMASASGASAAMYNSMRSSLKSGNNAGSRSRKQRQIDAVQTALGNKYLSEKDRRQLNAYLAKLKNS